VTDPSDGRHDLCLVRHGATEWSVDGRHTGRTDLPLLPEGEDQARRAGELLAGRPFALVLCSPLGRARETCALAGYADQAELTDDLREWDYGDYEGVTTAAIREHDPGWTIWDGVVPHGETADDVAARVDRVIARVRSVDGDAAVFAHGHVLRVLTARWCELDPREGRRFVLDTATLNVLGWEHEYPALRLWNQR
jgi:probable phosphoglycerate mutase